MKVVHLNTNLNITSAPYHLHRALLAKGIESRLLIFNECDIEGAESPKHDPAYKIRRHTVALKRESVMEKFTPDLYLPFSALPMGIDVSRHPFIEESDVICIHWVSGDYLSPKEIEQLLMTGKKVLIFCHDNCHFTGGCHVRLGCNKYKSGCGSCPQLCSFDREDISASLAKEKYDKYSKYLNYMVISPSTWMDNNVSQSFVFKDKPHKVLHNAIDTDTFRPYDRAVVRKLFDLPVDKKVVLTAFKANEKIPYNGAKYLWEVLEKLDPNIYVAMFGVDEISSEHSAGIHNLGFISDRDKLAKLYSASDVYFTTSLEDSFNQTVAECLACGTPVAAFENGGIADLIEHQKNGYLAEYKNSEDLVKGIEFLLDSDKKFSTRKKILSKFSYEAIADEFIKMVE